MAMARRSPAVRARGSSRICAASCSTVSSLSAVPSSIALYGLPSAVDAERNGDAQQVEQIAEMGVVAEHGVAVDGPGQHLVDGEGGADGRHDEHVHALPQPADLGLEFLQSLQRGERVDGGVLLAAAEDVADHGMDRVRLGGKEVAELDEPLGDPGALVEQRTRGQERLERDVDDRRRDGRGGRGSRGARVRISSSPKNSSSSTGGSPTRIGAPS